MARAWRIEYEGALYHVLSRGNERQDIFIDDDDRKLFLATVGDMSERFEIDIFAYVLMDHARIIITNSCDLILQLVHIPVKALLEHNAGEGLMPGKTGKLKSL